MGFSSRILLYPTIYASSLALRLFLILCVLFIICSKSQAIEMYANFTCKFLLILVSAYKVQEKRGKLSFIYIFLVLIYLREFLVLLGKVQNSYFSSYICILFARYSKSQAVDDAFISSVTYARLLKITFTVRIFPELSSSVGIFFPS